MLAPLANRTYRRLFLAQAIALAGTGLATVALALLAYDLAGGDAGAVLGTALAIKMVAYVGVAPVAGGLADRLPRRATLVALDLVRAAIAIALPFIDQVWHVYLLIFLLQAASASFTPLFQATIPEVLDDERDYTEALSLSRIAYDLESLLSPLLAAALLAVTSFHVLFAGTALGFAASAALVGATVLPRLEPVRARRFADRLTRGVRVFLRTPRLRGLLAVNLAVAAGGAMAIVNTVVYVRDRLGLGEGETALALAAFGAGSMLVAVALPPLLARLSDRPVMIAGAAAIAAVLLAAPLLDAQLAGLFALWVVLGAGYSLAQTPTGRVLRRSSSAADRPALFAAQFALSHAGWLLAYPLAGWAGAALGLDAAFLALGAIATAAASAAALLWPRTDAESLVHVHTDLVPGDPHLAGAEPTAAGYKHRHALVIDDAHGHWPWPDGAMHRL